MKKTICLLLAFLVIGFFADLQGKGVVVVKVCLESGLLASQDCPAVAKKFMEGSAPTKVCNLHLKQPIAKRIILEIIDIWKVFIGAIIPIRIQRRF
ncbi:MAG: hypothetical protein KAR20_29855 [Candidatus Heimdallarchaeota archaeon]|nr:hypothetical protein [Candidatus Heimdallarchaeota archaeon]